MRIARVEADKVVDLCVHHRMKGLPADDRVVGLALAAKLDEDHLKATANDQGWSDKVAIMDEVKKAANF